MPLEPGCSGQQHEDHQHQNPDTRRQAAMSKTTVRAPGTANGPQLPRKTRSAAETSVTWCARGASFSHASGSLWSCSRRRCPTVAPGSAPAGMEAVLAWGAVVASRVPTPTSDASTLARTLVSPVNGLPSTLSLTSSGRSPPTRFLLPPTTASIVSADSSTMAAASYAMPSFPTNRRLHSPLPELGPSPAGGAVSKAKVR